MDLGGFRGCGQFYLMGWVNRPLCGGATERTEDVVELKNCMFKKKEVRQGFGEGGAEAREWEGVRGDAV